MSRRRKGRSRDHSASDAALNFSPQLSSDTKKGITIIILFAISLLSILALFGQSGALFEMIVKVLSLIFGGVRWIFPFALLMLSYFMLREGKYQIKFVNYFGAVLTILALASLWHLQYSAADALYYAKKGLGGGFLGLSLSLPLLKLMSFWGAEVVSWALLLIGILLTFETSIYGLMWPFSFFGFIFKSLNNFFSGAMTRQPKVAQADEEDYEEEEEPAPIMKVKSQPIADEDEEVEEEEEEASFSQKEITETRPVEDQSFGVIKKFGKIIELPLELLVGRSGKPTSGDIKANQEVIKKTLGNFGIPVEMGDVNIGPTVTQYTLRPADGVRLSKIIQLNSDLALALAAHPIRIEAPIPGKSLVGVEIPNQIAAKVTMHDLISSKEFKERKNNLSIALGKDVSGKPCFAQLDRMPHLLIAGATGSGKSVCVNSLIISLLYQNSPDELKFILVDPKRVELPAYNGIPYLLTPVITDVKKTVNALKWAVTEMEKRFEILSHAGKRNIEQYNQAKPNEKLPYIVFIIDELADLMAAAGNEMEAGIVRLAQMARAVGIHLILATQRPSIEVITGLIKANVPARIAFSVASLIDSRTILDTSGAEKLVGRGDMLYLGPEVSKPKRIQGVYLSDKEISNVINHIKSQGEAQYVEGIADKQSGGFGGSGFGGGFSDDGDPLMGECKDIIRESGKASASLLQRRLKIGYARAARILDLLEEQGIIGPADGAKPREVFLDKLGGVGAVQFAAREHDLQGELRPIDDEPGFTDFSRKLDIPVSEVEEVIEEEEESEEDLAINDTDEDFSKNNDSVEADEEDENQENELNEAEDENPEEEITEEQKKDKMPEVKMTGAKKLFGDDEWS